MKRIVAILAALIIAKGAFAYEFSVVSPSGHSLFFKIVNSDSNFVKVTRNTLTPYSDSSWLSVNSGVLIIPNNVSYNGELYSVTEIDTACFKVTPIPIQMYPGCGYSLMIREIHIPSSVIEIHDSAFYGIPYVFIHSGTPPRISPWGNLTFTGADIQYYVPCNSYNAYYNAMINPNVSGFPIPYVHRMPDDYFVMKSNNISMGFVTSNWIGSTYGCDGINHTIVTALPTCPDGMFRFTHWEDGSMANPREIDIYQDTTLIAYFDTAYYVVHGSEYVRDTIHRGYVVGSDTVKYGDTVTLTAIADSGFHFVSWGYNNTYDVINPKVVIASNDEYHTAFFVGDPVNVTYRIGDSLHVGGGNILASGYSGYKETLYLEAIPDLGYQFSHWDDGSTSPCRTLLLMQDTTIVLYFDRLQIPLFVKSNDSILGGVTGNGIYNYLDTVQITAIPTEHNHFVRWEDSICGNINTGFICAPSYLSTSTINPRQVVVDDIYSMTAYFAIDTHSVNVVTNDIVRGNVVLR